MMPKELTLIKVVLRALPRDRPQRSLGQAQQQASRKPHEHPFPKNPDRNVAISGARTTMFLFLQLMVVPPIGGRVARVS
jgi:hypothetical protein